MTKKKPETKKFVYRVNVDYKASNVVSSAPTRMTYDNLNGVKSKVRYAMEQGVHLSHITVEKMPQEWELVDEFRVCPCGTPYDEPLEDESVCQHLRNVLYMNSKRERNPNGGLLPRTHPVRYLIQETP